MTQIESRSANWLQLSEGKPVSPVLDHTGLTGFYEVSLPVPGVPVRNLVRYAESPGGSASDASDPSGVDIFRSVEKLGLRLEKTKASIENLIVEHVEKLPTEN